MSPLSFSHNFSFASTELPLLSTRSHKLSLLLSHSHLHNAIPFLAIIFTYFFLPMVSIISLFLSLSLSLQEFVFQAIKSRSAGFRELGERANEHYISTIVPLGRAVPPLFSRASNDDSALPNINKRIMRETRYTNNLLHDLRQT